jgi:amino acid adenylation domain-containing protein
MLHPSSGELLVATFEVEAPRSSLQIASNGNGVSESSRNFDAGGAKKTSAYEQSNLTRGQLQIWMGQNLLPEVPIYNLAVGLNIRGVIDPVHFGKAFQTLVNSSEALRTILEEVDGIPMQRVVPNLPCELTVIDFSSLADPQETAKSWMQTRCQISLQWQKCLFDSALIKLTGSEFIWYLNVHHLICDGWSFELIYRLMAEFYQRSLQGQLPRYVNLFPYADYIAHERTHRESTRHRRSEAYWEQVLSESGEQIDFYGKTSAKTTTRLQRVSWDLGVERTRKLRSMAAGAKPETEEASLLESFAAVLVAYLYCLNRKAKYTIGIPFHNRRSKNFKETIGFFSEVLPVRLEVSEEDTFTSFISKVKREVFRAARHGQCSIANPYFRRAYDVVLNYHTRSFSDFAGMPALPQWVPNGHGDDSLAIQISDFASSSSLSVDFDLHQEVFGELDCERVVSHFLRVLDTFLADPERPLRLLSLTSPDEIKQLLEWNRPTNELLDERCIHHLIEEQAEVRPDAPAVVFENKQLSYQELNRRANQVAHYLRNRGVGSETLVGLYVERSLEMIVGLLGILKAGAAYVPIHAQYSAEWVKCVLTDTGTPIVLTQDHMLGRLPSDGPEAMTLDSSAQALSRESTENPDSGVTGGHLAYVIYTSGSTGRPKGVEITHRNLMNFAARTADFCRLGPSDRVLQFASIAFDTSVEEIFPCLMRGATLVLRTDGMLESAKAFIDGCVDCGITVLDLPTAYWHGLAASLFTDHLVLPRSVRLVIIGGEEAIPERLAQWQARVSRTVKLINTYGPTETTVTATVYDLTDYSGKNGSSEEIPIGAPIPNVQTYVLDQNLTPVPIGVPGELHVGGVGVARGYLNQPALTAKKFIRNPFSNDSESLLYKTGDLVRWRADGNLEYLGRLDRQVKIRGFRVELDGIETILKTHPLVKDAAVTQDCSSIQKRLVAYLTPKQGAVLNVAEVKNFVSTRLAEYMVPTTIIVMDSMPVSHSGKVNRRALPNPDDWSAPSCRSIEPPQTPTEARIADLWRELLGMKVVGRSDHFFELGGQSLLAAQLVSRIRKELTVEIPLRLIFEVPVLARFAERVDEALRSEERVTNVVPVLLSPHGHEAPVSQSQARIWYMHQLAPQSAAYNIAAPIRFTGVLQKEALTRSLEEMVRRHDSLRTTLRSTGGEPVQIISPALTLAIPEVDLANVPENGRLNEAKRILSEEARRPFDLENGPLIRVLLLRLADEDHVLLINMHHVISDQWSLGVLAREVTALYNGFSKSLSPSIDGLRPQYADFAIWQDQWLSPERLDAQLMYWKTQLADMEPLVLPTDDPRPSVQTFRGSYQSLNLSPGLVERLNRHAAHENATLYMIFLAAFKALLCRYSGQQDIAIGSPVANRSRLEWEEVVGTFINILVLRTDLSGNPSFRQVLQRVRQVVLDAFTNGDVPFEMLVKEVQSGRDPSRSPLIQVLFNFQSTPAAKIDLLGLSWMPFEIDQSSSQFDLSVTVDPEITRKILIAYNTDLYKADTITRMLRHYQRLLEAVAANPDHAIGTVSILTDEERRQLLQERNDNDVVFPQSCIHELFEAQAQKIPNAVAIEFEDQQITYKELDRRANEVAHRLRPMGVKPEALVGICVERSIELLVGLLGILKAGGAYVPIDPAYPPERIAFMIQDSGMAVLLTQQKLLEHLPQNGYLTVCLDTMTEVATSESTPSLSTAQPGNLAYVIYTSGSTGRPKGVEVEHRSLVNFLHSMKKKPGMIDRDVLLSVTTVSFDIATLEFFLPLTVGARVVLTSRETAADGRRLMQQIETSGATMMQATPTTWRMLTEAGWKGSEGFKVLCGGESLPVDLAKNLLNAGNAVWNLYGPTETTVWSTACQLEPNCNSVSIGRPIDNTRVYILDSNMEPVPMGVPGDLFVGGQGVARGYLNRPGLTGEKFVRDRYRRHSDERLFKTGDLARYLSDGNIEYLGRMDEQLKIRGHRVEPGEIEAALRDHPEVSQAVVVGREFVPGEMRLVAYVVTRHNRAWEQDQLRSFLMRKLPDYMVPSAFIPLEALPVAPGGKVNRQALPSPDSTACYPVKTFLAPRDRLELQLAQIWQSVINVKPVGVQDNFFGLGGHSLTLVKLLALIKTHLGVDLPVAAAFAAPTIEQLAKVIRERGWASPKNCLLEIRPGGSKPPLFLIGGGHALPSYLGPDQPVYGLSFLGMFETEIYPTSVKEIAASYVHSIRSVQPNGPYYLAGHSSGGNIAFEMAQLLDSQGEKVGLLALLDTYGPRSRSVSIRQILRAHWRAFTRRRPQERLAYVHFMVSRAISFVTIPIERMVWRILNRAFKSGKPVALTPKNLSMVYDAAFGNYVAQTYRGRGVLLRSKEAKAGVYDSADRGWTGMFAGGLEIHEVPGDHLSMLHEPHVRTLAECLNECLREPQLNKITDPD